MPVLGFPLHQVTYNFDAGRKSFGQRASSCARFLLQEDDLPEGDVRAEEAVESCVEGGIVEGTLEVHDSFPMFP